MKKLLALFIIVSLFFSMTGCKGKDKRVLDAIDELTEFWEDYYDEHDIDDRYLEIVNTQIINIENSLKDDVAENFFGEIDYIVEFEILTNAFENTSEYYTNNQLNNCVVVYKNGKSEVRSHLLLSYRAMTYSTDYSGIIDSIEKFHGEYDMVIELED